MNENVCNDNRFNLIAKYKAKLIEATNIETSQDEMAVIDNILFRMWQMGWLERLEQSTASPWHRVEDGLPKEPGEYIVAYHPCYWDDVKTKVTKVGIDNFRGKSAWAKKKFQRVTHWMEKPEPPKEDA